MKWYCPGWIAGVYENTTPPPQPQLPTLVEQTHRIFGYCTTLATRYAALLATAHEPVMSIKICKSNNRAETNGRFADYYPFVNLPNCKRCFGLHVKIRTRDGRDVSHSNFWSIYSTGGVPVDHDIVHLVYLTDAAHFSEVGILSANGSLLRLPTPSWVFCLARGDKSRPARTSNVYTVACYCNPADSIVFSCDYSS